MVDAADDGFHLGVILTFIIIKKFWLVWDTDAWAWVLALGAFSRHPHMTKEGIWAKGEKERREKEADGRPTWVLASLQKRGLGAKPSVVLMVPKTLFLVS